MASVPEWALGRVANLIAQEANGHSPSLTDARFAFARYIAAHEEPPVDPLLLEARELAAVAHENNGLGHQHAAPIRAGELDHKASNGVPLALAALKRGLELAEDLKIVEAEKGKSDA